MSELSFFKKAKHKTNQPAKTSANLNNWAESFVMLLLPGISYFLLKDLNLDHCALEISWEMPIPPALDTQKIHLKI